MARLCSANNIGTYHWWSIEQSLLEVICANLGHRLPVWMLERYVPFLRSFFAHPCSRFAQTFGLGPAIVEDLEHYGLTG